MRLFLIFLETILCKELGFFLRCIQCNRTLLLSYQNIYWTTFYIFHYKGEPFWFSGGKNLPAHTGSRRAREERDSFGNGMVTVIKCEGGVATVQIRNQSSPYHCAAFNISLWIIYIPGLLPHASWLMTLASCLLPPASSFLPPAHPLTSPPIVWVTTTSASREWEAGEVCPGNWEETFWHAT